MTRAAPSVGAVTDQNVDNARRHVGLSFLAG